MVVYFLSSMRSIFISMHLVFFIANTPKFFLTGVHAEIVCSACIWFRF